MSSYLDQKDLFIIPKVSQYGSHMVMSNVCKEIKTQFLNIDTRFRDEYNNTAYENVSNYTITLPYKFTDVKNISLTSIEIPLSYYNISESLGNNYFQIIISGTSTIITVPDGEYDISGLTSAIDTLLSSNHIHIVSVNTSGTTTTTGNVLTKFTTSNNVSAIINFNIDKNGNFDKYNLKSKLGWILGFREPSITILRNSTYISTSFIDINGPRYLYLVVDEYSSGTQKSFLPTLLTSQINKNILARITISKSIYGSSEIETANLKNGLLTTDTRIYSGKTDVQKLTVELVNEFGKSINLNGMDFSFCVKLEHE